jgi:outer membrane protein assembly factor BamA
MNRPTSKGAGCATGLLLVASILLVAPVTGNAQELEKDLRPSLAPDIREDETELKLQRGDFVAVPIPLSNPTLGSGLIAGAAYFYPQTEEQKAVQPASLTGIAAMYTDNDGKAFTIAQQNYWSNNRWRFTGAAGAADLKLKLLSAGGYDLDWRLKGKFFFTRLSGQVRKNWYTGFLARFVDVDQGIEATQQSSGPSQFGLLPEIRSAGIGTYVEFDTRDMPSNAYSGHYFKVDALFNDESIGSDRTYQNYNLVFNTYHQVSDSLVLAGQVQGCLRSDDVPLWDACTIKLRGFPATDFMGTASTSGQVEARWKLSERWGVVGFAGTGYARDVYSEIDNREWIPSYGAGVRFMVLKSKRINLRLDYARTSNSDAIHFLVGEAF